MFYVRYLFYCGVGLCCVYKLPLFLVVIGLSKVGGRSVSVQLFWSLSLQLWFLCWNSVGTATASVEACVCNLCPANTWIHNMCTELATQAAVLRLQRLLVLVFPVSYHLMGHLCRFNCAAANQSTQFMFTTSLRLLQCFPQSGKGRGGCCCSDKGASPDEHVKTVPLDRCV